MGTSFHRYCWTMLNFIRSFGGVRNHRFIGDGNMEFFKYKNKIKPERGRLLISEPFLPDPNFERTIILVCENNEDGSFGFVLNKPSLANVSELMDDIKNYDTPAMLGGPLPSGNRRVLSLITQNNPVRGQPLPSGGPTYPEPMLMELRPQSPDLLLLPIPSFSRMPFHKILNRKTIHSSQFNRGSLG